MEAAKGMKRRELLRVMAATGLALAAGVARAEKQVLEVIELRSRSAEEVVPMLKPLLAPGGTISGLRDQLIIRTTPANHAELRRILDTIDRVPKRLLVTVRQEDSALRDSRDFEASGSIGTDRARVTVPGTPGGGATVQGARGDDRARARVQGTQSAGSGRSLQTVQVLEGNAAFIRLGESVPIRNRTTVIGPGGAAAIDNTEFRNVEQGFYAQPRVSGDSVTVQIAAQRDTLLDRNTGASRIQRVGSVVSGRLGEWIELGGVVENADRVDTGTVTYRSSTGTDRRRTFIKVELVQ
jgi:hypothetical protein